MGLFCVMGKSASGKDTIYQTLAEDAQLGLSSVVLYTTRPMRSGEVQGETYHFVSEAAYQDFLAAGKVIEARAYDTVYGIWRYFMVDDGQIDLTKGNYVVIGTLESYGQIRTYFGETQVHPIYIQVEDGERLKRAIAREEAQSEPKYQEMCRRFLADSQDFSEETLRAHGIEKRYENTILQQCYEEIKADIVKEVASDG